MTDDRQDRNGVRTPVDVERRHKLGLIEKTAQEVEEIKGIDSNFSSTSTRAVQNKVITAAVNRLFNEKIDKVSGMGLSHNDYTDTDKNKVDNLDGHTHSNLQVLNSITSQDISNWNASHHDSYSTSEVVVGEWTDGRPVYRKVYNVGNVSAHNETSINLNINNYDKTVDLKGFNNIDTNPTNFDVPINFYNMSDGIGQYCFVDKGMGVIKFRSSWNVRGLYIILDYIKSNN